MTSELNLGTKHECPSCGTKYYDLGKPKAACPKCGSSEEEAEQAASKKS